MQPNDSLAEAIGLIGYSTDDKGVGGVLKSRVADFRVDEIATTIALNPKGRFTVAKVTLTNWETNRFCNNFDRTELRKAASGAKFGAKSDFEVPSVACAC